MDFSLSEEQEAVRALAAQILDGHLTPERRKEVAAGEDRVDRALWSELAKANLLGISLAEDVGGNGLGFMAAALVLEEIGRTAAPVPYLASVTMGALAIDRFGTAEQRQQYLPAAVEGGSIL